MSKIAEHLNAVPVQVLEEHDRLTVNFWATHEAYGEEPTTCELSFFLNLQSKQSQPYTRRIRLNKNWSPLDLGWVESAGYVVIVNRAGHQKQVMPSEEEQEREKRCYVKLKGSGSSSPTLLLIPPRGLAVLPLATPDWEICAVEDETPITITVFPR